MVDITKSTKPHLNWLSYLDFITNGHDQINMQHFSILSRQALKVYSKIWNQMPY